MSTVNKTMKSQWFAYEFYASEEESKTGFSYTTRPSFGLAMAIDRIPVLGARMPSFSSDGNPSTVVEFRNKSSDSNEKQTGMA